MWWSLCIGSEIWWDLVVPWCKSHSDTEPDEHVWEAPRLAQRNTQRASLPHGNHPLLQPGVTTGQNTHTQPLKRKCMHTFPCKISILSACQEQLSVLAMRAQVNCLPFMSQLNNQITLLQCEKEQTVWSCCMGGVCFQYVSSWSYSN